MKTKTHGLSMKELDDIEKDVRYGGSSGEDTVLIDRRLALRLIYALRRNRATTANLKSAIERLMEGDE